jgi:hypothetical protein
MMPRALAIGIASAKQFVGTGKRFKVLLLDPVKNHNEK